MNLNPNQSEAVKHRDGPLLIIAGAGSGKTRVIVNRIIYLIENYNVPPYQILAVTFTNKAANEMKERVSEALGGQPQVNIGTFHSICSRILRREAERIGLIPSFTIVDDSEQITRIKRAMKELGFNAETLKPRIVQEAISRAKNCFQSPDDFGRNTGFDIFRKQVAKIFLRYQECLKADYSLDFDDLINQAVTLFRDNHDLREKYQKKFRYLMVDEYQDTNHAQYQLILQLSYQYRNIMVVGDDDQSIYRWRGAEVSNILNFTKDFPGAKVIKLEQNYRSTQVILSAASDLMKNNSNRMEKRLWTDREGGEKIVFFRVHSDRAESETIVSKIQKMHAEDGRSFNEFAVFYRTNAQSRVFEEILLSKSLPYRVMGNIGFFKRKEIKDILSYIHLVLNPFDSGACRRIINVPRRGIGRATMEIIEKYAVDNEMDVFSAIEKVVETEAIPGYKLERLREFRDIVQHLIRVARTRTVAEVVHEILLRSGYRLFYEEQDNSEAIQSVEIIEEFENMVADYQDHLKGDLGSFADYLSLHDDPVSSDAEGGAGETISLLTLHNAKGLEYPVVFITGLEEGMCPYYRATSDFKKEDLDEERRLMYVGMTRAKERLFLSSVAERRLYGTVKTSKVSRFISEIPDQYLVKKDFIVLSTNRTSTPDRPQMDGNDLFELSKGTVKTSNGKFSPGQRIMHAKWGTGIVLKCHGMGPSAKITVSFDRSGIKKLNLGVARLTILN